MSEVAYRYEDKRYSVVIDPDAEIYGSSGPHLELREFSILRHTPCGFWIDGWHGQRFVKKDAWKRYACLTKDEALESYKARKKRQIRIYANRLREAEEALRLAEGKAFA